MSYGTAWGGLTSEQKAGGRAIGVTAASWDGGGGGWAGMLAGLCGAGAVSASQSMQQLWAGLRQQSPSGCGLIRRTGARRRRLGGWSWRSERRSKLTGRTGSAHRCRGTAACPSKHQSRRTSWLSVRLQAVPARVRVRNSFPPPTHPSWEDFVRCLFAAASRQTFAVGVAASAFCIAHPLRCLPPPPALQASRMQRHSRGTGGAMSGLRV